MQLRAARLERFDLQPGHAEDAPRLVDRYLERAAASIVSKASARLDQRTVICDRSRLALAQGVVGVFGLADAILARERDLTDRP